METAVLIQSRSNSSRLPGKIYEGLPRPSDPALLLHVVRRMRRTAGVDLVALVVPQNDRQVCDWAVAHSVPFFTGPEDDVRERYRAAARATGARIVVRATGDNPCVDPEKAADTIDRIKATGADLCSYLNLPLGMGVETFTAAALFDDRFAARPAHREHVSIHIKENPGDFKVDRFRCNETEGLEPLPRLTVDTAADLAVVRSVFEHLGSDFLVRDVMALFTEQPSLFADNINLKQKPIG